MSEASFAQLAMTGILKGMGVSGGRLFLDSFFFGGTKKNEEMRVQGIRPCVLVAQKEKVNRICKRHVYPKKINIFFLFFIYVYPVV